LFPPVSFNVFPLDLLVSVFPYGGAIRKAIIELKYHFVSDLVDELIDLTVRLIEPKRFEYTNKLILIPIPLYWQRRNWRGFNQAEIAGERIAEKMGFGFCSDLLIRTRPTKPQAKIKGKEVKRERRKNVLRAFKINPKYQRPIINNQSFILFDDVWTTGATMKECAVVLKNKGAKKVFGLTIAR